ncbi:MAG TPA: 16S rRNA (guanine(527)-N(7))-methyltransferase RsmG [Oribacterium sp.]|nr:16S rRNA (guanine(527)-N(7))-methyltransferase RsmG [Oribacterium sp.]
MTETFYNRLKEQSEALGIQLSDTQIEQLFTYYEMLVETNKVMNLTAITEESEVVTKHFIDSMAIVKASVKNENVSRETLSGKTLIDVGTGAGFPGLVLKIVFPECKVTLTDSLQKRLRFLDEVIARLGLQDVETIHGRAEDLGHQKQLREHYDLATSRAVANMSTLTEYDLPFVKEDGYFIAYKSGEVGEELASAENAIRKLGGKLEQEVEYVLPESDIHRSLISIRKAKETPKTYPRKAGTPAKDPLK